LILVTKLQQEIIAQVGAKMVVCPARLQAVSQAKTKMMVSLTDPPDID
jgi:hypothetical protein